MKNGCKKCHEKWGVKKKPHICIYPKISLINLNKGIIL